MEHVVQVYLKRTGATEQGGCACRCCKLAELPDIRNPLGLPCNPTVQRSKSVQDAEDHIQAC